MAWPEQALGLFGWGGFLLTRMRGVQLAGLRGELRGLGAMVEPFRHTLLRMALALAAFGVALLGLSLL
jgi:hypothetical protein